MPGKLEEEPDFIPEKRSLGVEMTESTSSELIEHGEREKN